MLWRRDDLGARMENAFLELTKTTPTLLIGTDCVAIKAALLARCAAVLQKGKDAVFLPVEDGGYILIGLKKPIRELFRNMPWTTEHVMTKTRRRAKEMGLKIEEPEILWDIDRPEDYTRALLLDAL